MNETGTGHLSGRTVSLWLLAASPTIWAAHFLLSYATAAVWCGKFAGAGAPLGVARWAIALYTLIALAGIAIFGVRGRALHRRAGSRLPHDDDAPESRSAFLGFATMLLSALSGVAIVFSALAAVLIGTCR